MTRTITAMTSATMAIVRVFMGVRVPKEGSRPNHAASAHRAAGLAGAR
jgi:hypothetical protein